MEVSAAWTHHTRAQYRTFPFPTPYASSVPHIPCAIRELRTANSILHTPAQYRTFRIANEP
eukprot:3810132-Rhodomonas_salina.3